MKKFLFSLFILVTLSACSNILSTQIKPDDLLHRNFVLIRFNDTEIQPHNMQPGIEFGENLYITARMCNYFTGNGNLNNNRLTITNITTSDLPCLDPNYKGLDSTVVNLLQQGVNISFDKQNQQITLSNDNNILIFKLMDWVY